MNPVDLIVIALIVAILGGAILFLRRAKKKGAAYSIIGNFPEKAKLDEIAKFSNYDIKPVHLDEYGKLVAEEVKAPVIKKRFK